MNRLGIKEIEQEKTMRKKAMWKKGVLFFSTEIERKIFFAMTMVMLLLGLVVKLM